MAFERKISKNLACAEDLLFGEGQASQTRNGGNYNLEKIRGFWPVNTQEEFDAIDPDLHPKVATVFEDTENPGKLVMTFYAWMNDTWVLIGSAGGTGARSFKTTVFIRQTAKPATPTGGDFANPVPPGWSDGVPAGDLTLWASTRTFTEDGEPPQDNAWTEPSQMTDTDTLDYEWSSAEIPGNPTDNPELWYNTPNETTIWQALRKKTNGVFGPWDIIKVKGEHGDDGLDANNSFKSTVFVRSATPPETPTGGDYTNPVPAGWFDGIPAGEERLWGSNRTFTNNGQPPQTPTWTTPAQMTDTDTIDYEWSSVASNPGNPTDNPGNWSNTPDENTIWQAIRKKTNGIYGPWDIIKVKGENPNDSFKSTVFVRATAQPAAPTGGDYDNPVPAGWSDGIPAGEEILWGSNRTFSVNGQPPQTPTWSTPAQMTDTESIDYEWSSVEANPGNPDTDPGNWSNTPDPNTIWQATRRKTNGVFGPWEVIRIRGEDGKDGDGVRYGDWFNVGTATGVWNDATAAAACPEGTPVVDDVVTIWQLTDTNNATTKRWDGSSWIAPGLVVHGDILSPGTVRGDRIVAGTEIIGPRVSGGVLNGGQVQMIGPNTMIVQNPTPFGPDGLIEWKGNKIVDVNGDPILASLTKSNAIQWLDADGNAYFGGSLSAGVLRSAATNPTLQPYATNESVVEIGPFSTNGGAKNIVISFNYSGQYTDTGTATCPVNPTQFAFSWRLERKIGSGSWTSMLTGTFTGQFTCEPNEPDPGQSVLWEGAAGSNTFLDSDATVANFSYRLVCTNYDRFMITNNVNTQTVTLASTEQ